VPRMELLVHASAASSKKDDDRYKRQARTYSAFDVAQTTSVLRSVSREPQEVDELRSNPGVTTHEALHVPTWSPSLLLDDTQLARTALESQFVTSSLRYQPECFVPSASVYREQSSASKDGSASGCTQEPWPVPGPRSSNTRRCFRSTSSPAKRHCLNAPNSTLLLERENLAVGHVSRKQPSGLLLPSTPSRGHNVTAIAGSRRNSSSSGDDIPSQLPSTYSLSNVASTASRQQDDLLLSSPAARGLSGILRSTSKHHATTSSSAHSARSPSSVKSSEKPASIISSLRHSAEPGPKVALSITYETVSPTLRLNSPSGEHTSDAETAHGSHGLSAFSGVLPASNAVDPVPTSRAMPVEVPMTISKPRPKDSIVSTSSGRLATNLTESILAMPPPPLAITKVSAPVSVTQSNREELALLRTLPLSISPGPPPTSSEPFFSHITPDLDKLYKNPSLSHCYRPRHTLRSFRQSERGHWRVDSSAWSVTLQISFWNFLRRHIGGEKAGWGVWCTREIDSKTVETEDSVPCLGLVKVFCWGEVVQHVYMLLYVASTSKIRNDSPAWIDAGEEVVVQM